MVCRLALLVAAGCSDYGLSDKTSSDEGGEPDIQVDPLEVALEGVCGGASTTVTVTNAGDAALTLSAVAVDGAGWSVEAIALPRDLDPAESLALALEGSPAEATLRIESDDPDQPLVLVPLQAQPDRAPQVVIASPLGAVLGPEEQVLEARVTDDVDAPESLRVGWASDVDGPIGTEPADGGGTVALTWPSGRTEGTHLLSATVTDSCGNTATDQVAICQQGGYDVDALDIDAWHFEGAATWDTANGWLQLTEPLTNQVGTAFQVDDPVSGDEVEIAFLFYIGDGTGADGLSLTALDTDRMETFLGGTGCGIGYGGDASCTAGPALPGWSIEVDTYYNAGQDPTEADHLMFTFDGDVDAPAVWAELPELEDTGWHTMVVTVQDPHVTVIIDETAYIDHDLSGLFDFPAYVGFTAGTGDQTNAHLVDSLTVAQYVCDE